MNVLILDTETTGLDTDPTAQLIEVGAILYNVAHRAVLNQLSFLMPVEDNPQCSINHITEYASQLIDFTPSLKMFDFLQSQAKYFVAHSAAFDKHFLQHWTLDKQWLCTANDFGFQRKKLCYLALDHGITVDPNRQHRALSDCQLLAEILSKVEDLEGLIELAAMPKVLVEAMVSFDDKHLAKSAGFSWNPVAKTWQCSLRESELEKLSFKWRKIRCQNQ